MDALERAVAERKLRHGNNPILTWCVSNAVVTRDPADNGKLDKSRSTGSIDGAVSLAMAINAMQMKPEQPAWTPLLAFA
jgi:phage terminase large subunit-like protein